MRKSDYPKVHRRWVAVMVILLLSSLLVSVSVCESADVDLGYTNGIWVDADDSPTWISPNEIRWGTSTGSGRSGYRFDGTGAQTFNFDEPFLIGTFWHFNWPITGSHITWADLEITLHFNNPHISPDPTFTFKFEHEETTNYKCSSGLCAYTPCVGTCPDKVTFPSAYPEETFVIGDKIYTLKIIGFEWPDGTLVDYFITQEKLDNYASLIGTLTALNPGISVTKTADPTSGAPSTDVTFTITVENTGDCTLNPVMVVDTLPGGMSYVSDDSGGSVSGQEITWNLGSIASGAPATTISLVAHIDTGASGTLTDTVTATGTPPHGDDVSDTDTADVTALTPGISVTKTADPTSGAPSTDVTFTITVENTGDCTLNPVMVVDTLPGGMSYVSDDSGGVEGPVGTITWNLGSIASGAPATTISLVAHIDTGASGTLTDTVTATGTPPHGDDVSDTDTADVTALAPGISVTKTADPTSGAPSTDVTFTITVENTGDCTLNPVMVVDTLPGGMSYVSDDSGGSVSGQEITWDLGSIASGAPATTISLVAHIDTGASGTLTDTVTATGTPPHGDDVSDTDTADVTALTPGISVTKTADPTSGAPSTDVTFTITVENTGDCTLNPVMVVDTLPGGMSYVSDDSGGSVSGQEITWDLGSIASGAPATTISLVAHIDTGASGTLTDTVTATGTPPHGDDVSDTDTADVTALAPGISVTKTADPTSGAPSTDVTFTITVENTGDCTLNPVMVVDTLPGGMSYVSDDSGGSVSGQEITWDLGSIASGAPATTISLVAHIDTGASGTLTDTVTATGTPPHGDDVSDTDTADVTALTPGISVTKTADPTSGAPSTDVTFTITVENTGDCTLNPVMVVDTLPGGMSYVSDDSGGSVSGQEITWDLGSIASGAPATTISLVAHIDTGASGTLTDSVTATGTPPHGDDVSDTDTADVTALAPGISVTKTADPTSGAPSTDVTFTITVENTGDCTLNPVMVVDTLPGGMSYVSDDSGGSVSGQEITWDLGSMGSSASTTISLVAHIDTGASGTLTDSVTATGTPPHGDDVSDTDTADVTALAPGISVTKTADPTSGAPSTDVTFTITVENTGDCTLNPVMVVDTLPGGMSYVSDDSGGSVSGQEITWDLGSIASGAPATTISLVAHIDTGASGTLTDTVTATGTPPHGDDVSDTDTADVTALTPGISVTKTADPTSGAPSTDVTFTITVENTGDCTLNPVMVVDTLPGGMSYVSDDSGGSVSGQEITWDLGSIASGAPATTISLVAHIDTGASGTLTDSVTATGTPPHGDDVSDTDTADVTALAPGISVTKTADPTSGAPSTDVTFTITVENTGDCTLNPVMVVDTLPGGMSYVSDDSGGSVSGQEITWDLGSMGSSASTTISLVAHIDTGASGTLTDSVTATGTPPHGDDVSDTDTADVTALTPGISVTKTADPTSGAPSTDVTFTITVENTGDCTLNPVMVVDTLPGGMSYVSDDSGGVEGPVGTITWNLGSIASGAPATTISLVAHIDTGASGTLTDSVTATGTPPHGDDVSDTDTADVTALTPGISVTKTADPTSGAPSTDVTFTITVENTGDCTLNPVMVVDTLPGGMSYVSDDSGGVEGPVGTITWNLGSIASGAPATTISLVAHIDTGASGTLTDSVTATGTPPHGDDVSDTDTADVTALTPGISVTKTADPTSGAPSTDVTFTITVENTGDCTLNPVMVVDTLPGGMSYVSDDSGGSVSGQEITWDLGSIASGAPATTISLVAHIDTGASGTLTDTVTATGTPPHGDDVSDTDTADVTALTPGISVTKTADPTSGAPSTDVTFTITVENTGDCTLNPVMVVDTLPGGMSYVSDDSGGSVSGQEITWDLGSIASGAPATTISLVAHIDTGASGTLTDSVTATGTPPHGDDVSDTDTADVTALAPGISVTKTADPTSGAPSTDVTFTITVENTGDCTLNPVMVVDTLPGGMSYVSDDSGGSVSGQEITWDLGSMGSSASTTISLVAHIDTGASGTLTDSVTATGTPPHGDDVSDTDTADVTALTPGISVTKTADPTSGAPSTDVTFTITVENTGDCTLNPVMVVDTLPGGMSYVSDDSGGVEGPVGTITWNLGSIASGAPATTISLVAHIDTGASGTLTDSVTATGTPPHGDDVSDTDTADVTALTPGISVTKTADPTSGAPSTDVTFTITVENTGDCTLNPVMVVDTLPGGMSYVSDDSGGVEGPVGTITWNLGSIASGAPATTISLVAHIDTGASGTLTDSVTATGTPPHGDDVSDTDTADVTALTPGISVTKTADPTSGAPSTDVTFTITVENTGDCTLNPVMVVDTLPGGMSYVSDDSGGVEGPVGTITWNLGSIASGAPATTISLVAHIDTGASGTLTDSVTATGTPPHGDDVSDTDTADVTALTPGISVTKTADPTSGAPSTDVTFTITVENTGDCTLNPVMVVDTLPGGMSYVSDDSGGSVSGQEITWDLGSIASGAPATTISLVAHIDTGASGTLTDTVTATGTPPHGDDVSDTDTADVTALTPGISVTKTADPTSGAPSTDVTFTITVENTGDCTLNPVMVVDTLPGGMSYVSDDSGGSVSGQEITWDLGSIASGAPATTISLVAHIDTGASGTLTDSVTATGTPPHGDDVSDTDTADVTALAPGISVTKTADPTSGAPSTDVTFTITVENTGDCTLNPVMVVDTLPGGMSYVSDDSGGSVSGQEITWDLGSIASGAPATTISLVAHIDTGASGTLTDSVTATGTPPHGDDVSDTDTADVTALTPGISVTKTADPTSGAPSTDVTFTITVENTGDCTLNPVMVVDTLPGGMSYVSDDSGGVEGPVGTITWDLGSIASGAPATTISLVAHIDTGASGTLTDSVTATGTPPHGDDVSDTDTADVTALTPGISVTKTADPTSGAPSTDVTFTITVENTGDCTLNPVMVVDTLPGGMSYVSDDSGGVEGPVGTITWDLGSIASGAPATTISLVAHIDTGASGTLTDTVTATGTPPHGDDVSDTDTADVTALTPGISVTKTADPTSGAPSTDVTFTITVENTGDCTLNPVMVVDTLPGGMSYVSDDSGGVEGPVGTITWNLGSIASGAPATTISLVAHIDTGASGTLTDSVTATGTPPHGDDVSDTDTADVTALTPGISVTKTADPTSGAPSTDVTFTITVENTGDCTLNPVMVVDTLPGGMSYVSDDSGGSVSGQEITWDLGSIASGAPATTISLVAHIDTGASGTLTDSVTATGTPPQGDDVSDTDTADVTALTPGISVTKTADPTSGAPSTDVTFTITVENTGDCTLNPVMVVDTLPGGMSYVSDDSGGVEGPVGTITWDLGSIASGAPATTISLVAHIDTGASGTLTDSVTATGTPPHGDDVSDTDTADVTALTPGISVTKTADPTSGAPSTDVTFTITVENTGDCTLNPVMVVDTLPGGMSYVSDDSGGSVSGQEITWNLGSIASGAPATTISLVAHIDTGASGTLTDSVTATGTPPHGDDVSDTDTADVTALTPGISVNKTANPTAGPVGTDITFTINVTNTGDCTLDPVRVTDELQQGLSYVSSDPIADIHNGIIIWENVGPLTASGMAGDSTTITLVANIDEGASGVLNNTVHVEGKPHCGDNVTDDDIAQVFVLSVVSVELEKTSSPAIVAPGGTVTYTIKYKNTGTAPLHNVVITEHYPKGVTFISASPAPDAGTNNVWTIGTLGPGESRTIVIKVKVPEQIDLSFTETGSVIGEGLVMVTKDLSTEQKPYWLKNRVTLSCNELAPVSRYATTKVSGVPGTSLGITESGSGVYSSDEILDLETKNKTIILKKTTHAEYKPTSFNFSDSFSVNFTNKWKQDICSKNMEIDAAIHKKISDATYIDDETISRVDKDKSTMSFDSSFNGSLHIGARTKDTAISETYIGEFDVLQTIQIAKGPIPTPAPTPTPTPIWLPCPFNASQEMNMTEEAEPTHDAKIKIEMSANRTSATVGDVIRYSYVVTNIGNINLTGVTVTDSNLGLVGLNRTELEPAEVASGTLLYTVNQSDVCANITNTADVTATDGCGDPVTNTSNQVIVTTDS